MCDSVLVSSSCVCDSVLFSSVCMYVCMYVYMYVCMYVRMYVDTYIPPIPPWASINTAAPTSCVCGLRQLRVVEPV